MLHLPGIDIRKKKSLFELRRWAVAKDVDLLDVGEGGFQVAKNVLHKHIEADMQLPCDVHVLITSYVNRLQPI